MNDKKKLRGFALMRPEKRKAISRLGGQRAHAKGTAHRFTAQEAQEAGRKGGLVVSSDKQHMARIGRLGGVATAESKRQIVEDAGHTPATETKEV